MTDDPRSPEQREPVDLVDRGPAETLAPSRTAIVLVAMAGLAVAVLAGLGALDVEGRTLADDEQLLEAGRHELVVGPVLLEAELRGGDWIARARCPRWLQLSDAHNDSSTLHLVWLDAVPLPSTAPTVELVPTPPDMPTWWREQLDLQVTPLGETVLDGRAVQRYDLDATDASRRRDGLVACGDVGGLAATGMFGPAARFDQQVALVDVDGTPLLLVAAAYTGGDPQHVGRALEGVLATGRLAVTD